MKVTEEQVIEYLRKLNYHNRKELDKKVEDKVRADDHTKYIKEKNRRKSVREQQKIEGEKFKNTIVPGMLVKMRGTNDGAGLREILGVVDTHRIECRKIKQTGFNKFKRDNYITTHMWDKIIKILHNSTDEFLKNPIPIK